MKSTVLLLAASLSLLFVGQAHPAQSAPALADSARTVAYVDGQVWNGERFVEQPLFVRDGRFVEQSTEADTTIDLGGGYVVPPFGEAHNHAFADPTSAAFADSLYLQNGVFYALSLTVPYSGAQEVRSQFEKPTTLDVAYAYGGVTVTGSHPAPAMERIYGEEHAETRWTLAGDAYWFMDTSADVREKWPAYLAQDPDVVKVYIIYSGDAEGRGACGYGLCPDVLRALVARAHDAGKRVFAHVNTAEDVQFALDVGVDALAHLPLGNDGIAIEEADPFRLSAETIQRVGEHGMIVTPTASLLAEDLETFRADTLQEELALQRSQLRRLHADRSRRRRVEHASDSGGHVPECL